ncbi:hypothetical protein JB92DRAFT_1538974 [Gautieria morchelliformis]|nr:hypothetical protein JB92DRAFT_1538974 [Gautieria morchelliformis]
MSYDPFAATNAQRHQHQPSYDDSTGYDPYGQSAPQPHPSYDLHPAPYKDEDPVPSRAMGAPVEDKEFNPFDPPPKSTGDLRMWRHDRQGNLWTKGGRGRCIGRFCCCTIMIVILLFVSIVLTLAVFLRPPDIEFSGVKASTTDSAVVATSSDLQVNLGIGISVRNPNFFSVAFKSITANVTYPINNTQIGGGVQNNVVFKSNSKTSFDFPFTLHYSQAADPDSKIITDIVTKCGFIPGSAKQKLSIGYTLKLSIQVLAVTIAPPISGTASFDCPFTLSEIEPLIGSIPGLSSILGGISG